MGKKEARKLGSDIAVVALKLVNSLSPKSLEACQKLPNAHSRIRATCCMRSNACYLCMPGYLSNLICCMLSMYAVLRRSKDLSSTISLSRCDLSSMMTDSVYTYGIYYSLDIW